MCISLFVKNDQPEAFSSSIRFNYARVNSAHLYGCPLNIPYLHEY